MKQWESEGLVLRTRPYGESDKLVTLFTLKEGKVAALARGARKTRSKLSAVVDLFSQGDYLLYRGRNLATIQQVSLLENFRAIREDVSLYFIALYICEVLEKVLEEHHPAESVYELALLTLHTLKDGHADRELVARSFEIMLLKELGYCPSLTGCLACGREEPPFILSPSAGGLLCHTCRQGEPGIHLSPGNIALMERILARGMEGVKVVKAPPKQLAELSQVTWEFLLYTTGIKNVKSRIYLEKPPKG